MIRKLKDPSGYTIIEVMVAIMILTIAILPMVSMFDAGLNASSAAGNYDRARALANANLEDAKADPPATPSSAACPNTNGAPATMDSCTVEAEHVYVDDSTSPAQFKSSGAGDPKDLIRVTVTVEWDGGAKSYETTGVTGA